ncbi:MAG: hypothetical protein BWK73_44450 [Thiothrix lacustris]|uniref:OmpA-like domain-containing protein n=1 Tax=Thiothrix lacustris TaxID=525917 RepID=A0A1Y1QBE9_9GAMM|nr:MAG: hypothetical protein BWK73_44450 [Thiothrix lacustris]
MQQAKQLSNESDGFIEDATETGAPSLNTGYVGGKTRIGIGIDSEFKGKADLSHVFTETEDTAVIGQGYIGVNPKKDDAKGHITGAGAKLNYHWVSKDEAGQASHVNKVFGAYDQNGSSDKDGKQAKKVTVGYGQERENMFWSGSVMKGLSDKFDTGQKDKNGNTIYEKGYDWGVGGRVGTFISEQQMRVQGGLDYEWGTEQAATESKAKQVTLTGGVEKFFPDSPHSVNANIDVYKKSGGYVEGDQKAEVRGGVGYRYDLASESGIWQADKMYRRVRTEIPGEEVKKPAKVERKLVKHTMELEADSFFKVDSAKLTPEALERMNSVAAKMRECGSEGNIRISGNTCDIGSTAHNQKLSERRANSVREFLIKNGFPAETLLAQGLGESSPKYPNTESERHKNRRVDVEYVCYQNEYKDQVVEEGGATRTDPKVVWKQELIPTPPLWVRQGLHNVADHKQRVDTYKTTAGGEKEPEVCTTLNAKDDANNKVTLDSSNNTIKVLDNDDGCAKDTAIITKLGTPSKGGTVTISADKKTVIYTPKAGFTGDETFTYEITDENGNTSEATVTVTVDADSCSVPVAKDDGETVITQGNTSVLDLLKNDEICDKANTKITKVMCGTDDVSNFITNGGKDFTITTDSTTPVGTKQCSYTIEDKDGNTSSANFSVKVEKSTNSCPVDTTKTGDMLYNYSNTSIYEKDIGITEFLPSDKTIDDVESVVMVNRNGQEVSAMDFIATASNGVIVDAGDLTVTADKKIRFKSSTSNYCEHGTFTFRIKLKDCTTPITVNYTITEDVHN